jgi:hypothetical protein
MPRPSKIWRKKLQLKKGKKFYKNCKLLIPKPPQRTSKQQEKHSAPKREHPVDPALQNMKGARGLNQSIQLIKLTYPFHKRHPPHLQQRWPEGQQRREGSKSINIPHDTHLSVSQMISTSSTAEVTRGAAGEIWLPINQCASWNSPVHHIW